LGTVVFQVSLLHECLVTINSSPVGFLVFLKEESQISSKMDPHVLDRIVLLSKSRSIIVLKEEARILRCRHFQDKCSKAASSPVS